ncbi:phosphoheptose isomerase [Caballeronia catudaia]|uniref:Phosphoheptose isomerase n=1 Tax=Caballeronia catudaia TaxID=1777136 RepID=A0A157ZS99_9BURK|nr:D-sedoheptulose 7-phosphate isomerase [Caballeronia catudaia]SAK48398.1 phosphoheptose isomerase [Caballeronia catudaia]
MSSIFLANLDEHAAMISRLASLNEEIGAAIDIIATSMRHDGKLMLCGNGGSAADSQHLAAEFTGRFIKDRRPLPALALSTDTSALTCISNDYSFDDVFSRQIAALGRKGDTLIGISTSGNSANVLRAVEYAKEMGIHTIGLLGREGGKLAKLCDMSIIVPSSVTARIQEAHILIGHTICGAVEVALGLAHSVEQS